ncbi:hypothetical protein ABZU32_15530 [Sphaerisporangium sp. NPDC005288]|uniref:Prephenate dehydratase domain-containing protein n=1 Tax=Sphaerisporangium rhizosphaerae TaxID=2269375 RepID=A0ABW2PEX3_9ACTN
MELLGWMEIDALSRVVLKEIGTLGPAGTSSETAATLLWEKLSELPSEPQLSLYDTYEGACDALLNRDISHFIVANAYRAVNEFYMDTRLALAGAFIMDTPLYGLAKSRGNDALPVRPSIATHPAPAPLIAQLLPAPFAQGKVMIMNSTSAAAMAASGGFSDLALTTAPAVDHYGLEFISRTRPIRMVWSVFVLDDLDATAADIHRENADVVPR